MDAYAVRPGKFREPAVPGAANRFNIRGDTPSVVSIEGVVFMMFMARTASAPERKRSLTPPSMCGLMARTLRRTSLPRGSAMSVIDMSRQKANDGQWRPPKVVEKSMRKFSKLKSRKASTRRPLPPPHVYRAYTCTGPRRNTTNPAEGVRRRWATPLAGEAVPRAGRFGPRRRGRRRASEQVLACKAIEGFGAPARAERSHGQNAGVDFRA